MENKYIANAVGRRKSAVARVYVAEGSGNITINKRTLEQYFPSTILQFVVKQPLNLLEVAEKYDIKVNLFGGGSAQGTSSLPVQQALISLSGRRVPLWQTLRDAMLRLALVFSI